MAQQKPKKTLIEKCGGYMKYVLGVQALLVLVLWIVYAIVKSGEDKNKNVVDEVRGNVDEIVISAVLSDDTSTTSPPSSASYKVEFTYNNNIYNKNVQSSSPTLLNIGDPLTLYIVNKDVSTVSAKKPADPIQISLFFLFIASVFTVSLGIGIGIYKFLPTLACFIVLLNVFIIIISALKGSKVI